MIQRRDFITLLGGAAAAWPLAAPAQERERVRRIAVLMGFAADDPVAQRRVLAFAQALAQLGWIDGRNVRIEIRWGMGDPERIRGYAAELVALGPDLILAIGSATTSLVLQATRAIPIVFVQVADPVGAGFVEALARPGGNATGFMLYEFGIGGKWLEVLKEVAPGVKRAAVLRTLAAALGPAQFGAIQAVAPSFGVELIPINMREASEIERAVTAFAGSANGGLIVTGGAASYNYNRKLIIRLAHQFRLPAVYPDPVFVAEGGLLAYGPDRVDQYRQAAGYVDRILKGEKPANLPVQAPTKYELVINLKTAKALGITVPPTLLVRADEVIE